MFPARAVCGATLPIVGETKRNSTDNMVLKPELPLLERRRFLRQMALAAGTAQLAACASVPDVFGLRPLDIGLRNRLPKSQQTRLTAEEALQQQYDLQRALSDAPLVTGNRTTLLSGGAAAFEAMFMALEKARDSINLEYFILDDVAWNGRSLSQVLLAKLNSGVRVNMIYDSFGSRGTPAAFFQQLRAAGARIIAFNPIDPFEARAGWAPNDRDHRKIMVIDGHIGFTGGINLDKAYENPPSAGAASGDSAKAYWRDTALRIEGPAVAELQKLFFGSWRDQKAPPVEPAGYFPPLPRLGVQTVRIIGSSPGEKQPLYYASLLTAINSARNRIWLCSGYFVPPHQEREALAKAARDGIEVRIVTPAYSDVQSAVYAARAAYGDLLEAGAKIYEIHDSILHAKTAVVDDTWTVVGSSNLDRRSVVFNNEVDAVVLGHNMAGQVESVLRDYMAAARPVDLARWRRRSLGERLDELEARVWQYWM